MKKQPDGSVILTKLEIKSLAKMLTACSFMLASFPSSGEDLMGADNYYALGMWEDKIKGNSPQLDWYIDEEEDEENSLKGKVKTVDQWLDAYGRKKG